jgi:hypothetical protein
MVLMMQLCNIFIPALLSEVFNRPHDKTLWVNISVLNQDRTFVGERLGLWVVNHPVELLSDKVLLALIFPHLRGLLACALIGLLLLSLTRQLLLLSLLMFNIGFYR